MEEGEGEGHAGGARASALGRDTSKMRQHAPQPPEGSAGDRSHSRTVRLSKAGQPPVERGTEHRLLSAGVLARGTHATR